MSLEDIVTDYFSDDCNEYFILKGEISGALSTFVDPIVNTDQGWDFNKNPIYNPYETSENVYFVLSQYKSKDKIISGIFNIQIFTQIGDIYELAIGTGVLNHTGLEFNMTSEESVLGRLTYDKKECLFRSTRFSNAGKLFIDVGEFDQISLCEFSASGITLMNTN